MVSIGADKLAEGLTLGELLPGGQHLALIQKNHSVRVCQKRDQIRNISENNQNEYETL